VIPIFADVMNAKRWVHASPSFMQFDIEHPETSGKKECFRAIEESAAYIAQGHQRIIETITHHKSKEVVFCGGASKGNLWPQILSDVLGVTIKVPIVKESTALGAAICAGVGVGLFSDLKQTAKKLVRWEKTFQPNTANHEAYGELYARWEKVYKRALSMAEDGIVKPLWWAAGA
jgi:autoinducer 2 (AI-2) kinase